MSLAGQGGMTTVHLAQKTHLVRSMGPRVVFLDSGTNDLLSGYECLKCLFEFWLSLRLSLKTSLTRLHSSYQCHPYLFKKGWSVTSFILWSTDKQRKSSSWLSARTPPHPLMPPMKTSSLILDIKRQTHQRFGVQTVKHGYMPANCDGPQWKSYGKCIQHLGLPINFKRFTFMIV